MNHRLLISGGRLIDPASGHDAPADLLIEDGHIAWVGPGAPPQELDAILDATGLVVAPGFVDLHCHLREPGYEEKETIATATRAATRGGFTTVCAMPNTNPPTDSAAIIDFIKEKARTKGVVKVLPVGCISKGRRGQELAEMAAMAAAGAVAFSDDGSPVSDPRLMRHALEYSLSFGLPIMEHAEDEALSRDGAMHEGEVSLRLGLRGIPAAAEEAAVARDIALARLTGAKLHLCHISTAGAMEMVRRAREEGLPVTAEVTPHHLTLTHEQVLAPVPYDTSAKVNPPLRAPQDVRALVDGLRDGVIDAIATDHAPHTAMDKLVEFDFAPPGISGLETALGALLALVHSGEMDLMTLVTRLTTGPAKVIGHPLGSLTVGLPADVVLFDPTREWVVDPTAFASRGRNTPLAGRALRGKVMATLAQGVLAYRDEAVSLSLSSQAEPQRIRG
ncbi:MAG: dihydroorotase [Dehalococcoidia bacterium]|jgi:dihydroorotase|nr:dihydroorotase [Dehalococcoidia bacterium]MDP6782072.1 dihydroorotase [Dehalococcoidia bacterium]